MKLIVLTLPFMFLISIGSPAQVPPFKIGDRVTFIGDSITHGGGYHPNIYLYYATRFPSHPFFTYNCGISGDTAHGTNKRFEMDIAVHKPNVATIMLGMNDAWAWCFDKNGPPQNLVEGPKTAFKTYTNAMEQLATALKELDCRLIFITPSIYDQTAELERYNAFGKNDLLGKFSEHLKSIAPKFDATIIDFHERMNKVNAKLQAEDPSATVVGPDRVHPGPAGHFVMSYAFLKAQGLPSVVSSIKFDMKKLYSVEQENCSIGVIIEKAGLFFTCLEKALPFPVAQDQRQALDWVPFQQELNQQTFRVTNLAEGTYQLSIDDMVVGQYDAAILARGINLAENEKTPQYQQALTVRQVLNKKLAITAKLRSIMHARHTMLNKIKPQPNLDDPEALKTALMAHVEKSKGESWYGYIKSQAEAFLEHFPNEEALRAEEEKLMQEIWTINKPQTHQWTLRPIQKEC